MISTPNDKAFAHYAVAEFAPVSGGEKSGLAKECIVSCDMNSFERLKSPSRIDGYVFGVCTAGEARLQVNLQEFDLRPNTIFLASPKHLVQLIENNGFEGRLLMISSQLFGRIHVDTRQLMPLSIEVQQHCISLVENDVKSLVCYIDRIASEIEASEKRFGFELLTSLLASMMYKVGLVVCNSITTAPKMESAGSRAEDYFKQFIRVLSQNYLHERAVSYYAAKLNITPKYLTTLIKRVSGRSVSDWIDYYVILEAKTMLKFSDRSIQEISNELNFANQSFFGSYFRRIVGMSPSQYRATC